MRLVRWMGVGMLALSAASAALLAIFARTVGVPPGLGVNDGRLAPCPASPNCVSSQTVPADREHFLPPWRLTSPLPEAQTRLRAILAAQPRTTILREEPGYLHAVVRSALFGFPDDIEFYLDSDAGLIHFRSAARLGQGDLGVNRARVEALSAAFRSASAR